MLGGKAVSTEIDMTLYLVKYMRFARGSRCPRVELVNWYEVFEGQSSGIRKLKY